MMTMRHQAFSYAMNQSEYKEARNFRTSASSTGHPQYYKQAKVQNPENLYRSIKERSEEKKDKDKDKDK